MSEPITKNNFFERGRSFIRVNEGSIAISPGSQEWRLWERYFVEHLQWEPWALKAARTKQIEAMTVPARWPQWFDGSFIE